ncbi:Effector of nucleoid occlusion Noc [Pelagirhabdus alkalitolerans]|uniref:Nucleoid occlusion protein n=1 Tax=Pelagirhabdus alkalitolerans TaxID=1612202 RepID=A0A1G6LBJ6_9BACI|nr:Effector of nucleoid occlusion Noc [Pelagirhabdus alkalitolerans]
MIILPPFSRIFGMGDREEATEETYSQSEVVYIEIGEIAPNRYQPRTIFEQEKIDELAQTIHTHGMIQPIVVRELEEESDKKYEIIAGERRFRAVTLLEWDRVPAIIRKMNDKEVASVALIENLQREELTVIEEARAYDRLIEIHELTQEALAQRLGKSQSTVANKMRLLKLPEPVQTAMLNKSITERHARALIGLKDEDKQIKLLNEIINNELNVKQTEARIAKMLEEKPKKKKPRLKGISKDLRIAMNTIRQSVDMVSETGVNLETDEQDLDDYYQITIKIPKQNHK